MVALFNANYDSWKEVCQERERYEAAKKDAASWQQQYGPWERSCVSWEEPYPNSSWGLSIVRRILEKLDGEVGVESKCGHGSEFFFTLTAAE